MVEVLGEEAIMIFQAELLLLGALSLSEGVASRHWLEMVAMGTSMLLRGPHALVASGRRRRRGTRAMRMKALAG